jgi:hypothetical protein
VNVFSGGRVTKAALKEADLVEKVSNGFEIEIFHSFPEKTLDSVI